MLIALIFIVEAFKKLFHVLDHNQIDNLGDVERYCHCIPPNLTAHGNITDSYDSG